MTNWSNSITRYDERSLNENDRWIGPGASLKYMFFILFYFLCVRFFCVSSKFARYQSFNIHITRHYFRIVFAALQRCRFVRVPGFFFLSFSLSLSLNIIFTCHSHTMQRAREQSDNGLNCCGFAVWPERLFLGYGSLVRARWLKSRNLPLLAPARVISPWFFWTDASWIQLHPDVDGLVHWQAALPFYCL